MRARVVVACFLFCLAVIFSIKHRFGETKNQRWDFQAFYLGGQMVRHGEGSHLYDLKSQARAQMLYLDRTRQVTTPDRPYIYPPAMAALFAPLAELPMEWAYRVWTALNILLLLAVVRILQKILSLSQNDYPFFAALLFSPVYLTLLKGQVSLLILLLVTAAFYFFAKDRLWLSGLMLGLATLKFQVVLGLLAVLALRRMWLLLAGSVAGSIVVFALSIAVAGWKGVARYPTFLREVAYNSDVAYTNVTVTLRGLLFIIFRHEPRVWLVALLSAGLVALVAWIWHDPIAGFSAAVALSLLTSYHAHFEELSLLVIPLAVLLSRVRRPAVAKYLTLGIILVTYLSFITGKTHIVFTFMSCALVIVALRKTLPIEAPIEHAPLTTA